MAKRQVRIQSDGTGVDTVVTTAEGAKLHPGSATIWIEHGAANRVELGFDGPALDVHAILHETSMTCPVCSHTDTHHCRGTL